MSYNAYATLLIAIASPYEPTVPTNATFLLHLYTKLLSSFARNAFHLDYKATCNDLSIDISCFMVIISPMSLMCYSTLNNCS